jgi:hypothetical protein
MLGKTGVIRGKVDINVGGVKKHSMSIDSYATTRFHSALLRVPCLRLWYLARSQDTKGRGIVTLEWDDILKVLEISRATLYRYLKNGKELGAFRGWLKKGAKVTLYLGSLFQVSKNLKLPDWGAVDDLAIWEVLDQYRAFATLLTTNSIQEKSFFAKRKEVVKSKFPNAGIQHKGKEIVCNPLRTKRGRGLFQSLEKYHPLNLFRAKGKLSSGSAQGQEAIARVLDKRKGKLYVAEKFYGVVELFLCFSGEPYNYVCGYANAGNIFSKFFYSGNDISFFE